MKKKSLNVAQLKLRKETISNLQEVSGGHLPSVDTVCGTDTNGGYRVTVNCYDPTHNPTDRDCRWIECFHPLKVADIGRIDTIAFVGPGTETNEDLGIVALGDGIAYA